MADCDDVDAIEATLKGMKRHHTETGSVPIIIHTSGTGVIADDSAGDFRPETETYDDLNPDQIETLADTQQHRNVDLELVKADKEGYVKTSASKIPIPFKFRHSYEPRWLVVGVVWWSGEKPDGVAHGREGFYFCENGEHTLYQVGKAIAEALITVRKAANPEPSTFTPEEINEYFKGSTFWGSNSRSRGNRSRLLGWKPKKTTSDLLASILPEVEEKCLERDIYAPCKYINIHCSTRRNPCIYVAIVKYLLLITARGLIIHPVLLKQHYSGQDLITN
ncbi:hypothetical protein BDZ97DRAFT_458986 [Flammula alnicola]|nr:hypothetical protein BDZ97DRAFT_458986 [Flammula alnicola]